MTGKRPTAVDPLAEPLRLYLDALSSEPVPDHLVQLAQTLQARLERQRAAKAAAALADSDTD